MQGVSPSLVSEICALAKVDPDIPTTQLQLSEWERLHKKWRDWLLTVSSGSFAPYVQPETGRVSVICSDCSSRSQRGDLREVQQGMDTPEDASSSGRHSGRCSVHRLLDSAIRSTEVSPLALQCQTTYLNQSTPGGLPRQLVSGNRRKSVACQRRGRRPLLGSSSSCSVR